MGFEIPVAKEMCNVIFTPCEVVVDAKDIVTFLEKVLTEMGS